MMETSSAIPLNLLHHASGTRHLAERLAEHRGRLDEAQSVFLASRPDQRLIGPLPDVASEMSRLASLTFELASFTGRIGAAFLRADTGSVSAPVTLDDRSLLLAVPSAATAALPLLADLLGVDVEDRRAIVECLPDESIEALIDADSEFMGNTSAIPEPIRYRANLRHVLGDLRRAIAHLDGAAVTRLSSLLHPPGGGSPQILLYQPDDHRVAVVFGDLATAAHLAVLVPGCGTTVDNFSADVAGRAHNLFQAASSVATGGVAVVAWLGYDAPPMSQGERARPAQDGSRALADLLAGLGRRTDSTLTLVGHSYGTLVVGKAMAFKPAVNDIVLLGSPGTGVDRASDLPLPASGNVYAEEIRGDPVGRFEWFGIEPTSGSFGGVRLTTNAPGQVPIGGGVDAHAHSQYFVQGSEALANIAFVVAGRGNDAQRQRATLGEEVADAERQADPFLHPQGELLDRLAERYDGPGGAIDGLDHLSRFERFVEHNGSRLAVDEGKKLVDGGVDGVKRVAGWLS